MQVKAWHEEVTIPTYKTGKPDKNPMFLEKRVYQGSSGAVYPHAVIDKVYDEKEDKIYKAVFIENEYLKIMILPELGGRIQMALDKTNDYHFVYYNRVIKPALVGLAGPWISGGIEFNWPQHHRPSTFDPVDVYIEENKDGSKTVWVNEVEQMFHTKGMAGFTLYPGKAYLEVKGRLYNRTSLPQSFLWWANPAVSVDEAYQSVFPPDVHAVYDHGKRDVSSFPIATGTYYNVDYSPGTDISRYKNIPVPTSYMAVNSAFDFVGGYNHDKQAGFLHVADHHISPGKKQWTWGSGEFGKAWDRHLTDEDGPYFEIMTGVFTDNQPDFGWIMPNEERRFSQYFMPYKNIGCVKNATIHAMINFEIDQSTGKKNNEATIKIYVTGEQKNILLRLCIADEIYFEDHADLSPAKSYEKNIPLPEIFKEEELKIKVYDNTGIVLVEYTPVPRQNVPVPDPAKPIGAPEEIETNEELFLAGQHLEQYRHATYSPVPYYEEALLRDPSDVRSNNALGAWYFRRGQFAKSEDYFRNAIQKLLKHNPNPYDGEPLYNLGLSLAQQKKWDEAFSAFYKSCWSNAWQDKGYLWLARIETIRKNFAQALEFAENSIVKNYHSFQARHLKTALLRKLKRLNEAEVFAEDTLALDPFDFGSGNELYLALRDQHKTHEAEEWNKELNQRMRAEPNNYIEIAIDYAQAGLYTEAIDLLKDIAIHANNPFVLYYLAYYSLCDNKKLEASEFAAQAFSVPAGPSFSNRLEDIDMLQAIAALNPSDYKLWFYLGNIWYDKRQYEEAIDAWERSREIFDGFSTVHRNLGIAYYNRQRRKEAAFVSYEKAFASDNTDSRILYELDQLRKRLNHSPIARLQLLNGHRGLIDDRDDLYIEYVTLLNQTMQHEKALRLLSSRNFHPWEGGEGKVSGQYTLTHIELAKTAIRESRLNDAVRLLKSAEAYPENIGEGKLFGTLENDIHYWTGCAYEESGEIGLAIQYWKKAAAANIKLAPAFFYSDQQPDKIFYQGLALLKLERNEESYSLFNTLIAYGKEHLNDQVRIDYFAVSLPDLMIFDDDPDKRNKIHCRYLSGLGEMGLGNTVDAHKQFKQVLEMDSSHMGATLHLKMIQDTGIDIKLLHTGNN